MELLNLISVEAKLGFETFKFDQTKRRVLVGFARKVTLGSWQVGIYLLAEPTLCYRFGVLWPLM